MAAAAAAKSEAPAAKVTVVLRLGAGAPASTWPVLLLLTPRTGGVTTGACCCPSASNKEGVVQGSTLLQQGTTFSAEAVRARCCCCSPAFPAKDPAEPDDEDVVATPATRPSPATEAKLLLMLTLPVCGSFPPKGPLLSTRAWSSAGTPSCRCCLCCCCCRGSAPLASPEVPAEHGKETGDTWASTFAATATAPIPVLPHPAAPILPSPLPCRRCRWLRRSQPDMHAVRSNGTPRLMMVIFAT